MSEQSGQKKKSGHTPSMRELMDIVNEYADYKVENVSESADKTQITLILKRD